MATYAPVAPGERIKPKTRWIWNIFWVLFIVTIIEVAIALPGPRAALGHFAFRVILIFFTLFKAYFIVAYYMHLKDEVKSLIMSVVLPFILIIYLIVLMLVEGSYVTLYRTFIEQVLIRS